MAVRLRQKCVLVKSVIDICTKKLWVQRMNNIRNRAEEVVLNEIIYR